MINFTENPLIYAVRDKAGFERALRANVKVIFLLQTNITELSDKIRDAKAHGKLLFVHIDFADGIGKDSFGVKYIRSLGADGIISTKPSVIKAAKECGILCVQRFFMVDSRSVDTALESVRQNHPDMIEVMPGIAYKAIQKMSAGAGVPVIAGGLIESYEEVTQALAFGASAVSFSSARVLVVMSQTSEGPKY